LSNYVKRAGALAAAPRGSSVTYHRDDTMAFSRPFALICLASLTAGCGGDPARGPASPEATPEPAAPAAPAASTEPAVPTAVTASPALPPPIPETADPANHYLDGDTWFTANVAYDANFIYAQPAQQLAPPGQDGKTKFWDFYAKKEFSTQHFWKSRAAKPEELAVGQLALLAHKKDGQGVYVAPGSVKEAYGTRWWITRVVSTRPQAEGFVLLAGGYRAAPSSIRFLEGDTSPAIKMQGKEDAHFLADEHWFAGREALPEANHHYVDPAVPAKPDAPMEGGEGRFVLTNTGKLLLTAHAWQTRMAKRGELKKGQLVIAPNLKDGSKYRAPKTRVEALASRWWAVKIEDTGNLAKGSVKVAGGYEIAADALRIVK